MQHDILPVPAARLGECPIWCGQTGTLWWVDVLEGALWSFTPANGSYVNHKIQARRLGSIALRADGGLLLACDNGLFAYDPETGSQRFLMDPEPGMPAHRKNDGRADWLGNFWIGTLRETDYANVGSLYRVTPQGHATLEDHGLAIPNSLAFDMDRKRLYYCDTRAFRIWVRDYDPANDRIGQKRLFAETKAPARPDGSCIDVEGCLWNAEYAGGRVVRYDPDGRILQSIELPVSHPTCCCFGGDNLDKLYITSAYEPLSETQRAAEPLAGKILVLQTGVRGRPEFKVGL